MEKRRGKKTAQLRWKQELCEWNCSGCGDNYDPITLALLPSLACPRCSMERQVSDVLRRSTSKRGVRGHNGRDCVTGMEEN